MMKDNTHTVSYIIYGYPDDLAKLTRAIGINPDLIRAKGEVYDINSAPTPVPQSVWELKSRLDAKEDPEKHIEDLLQLLEPVKKQLIETTWEYRAVFSVGSYVHDTGFEFQLEGALVRRIAELGAGIWLDVYVDSDE